MFKINTFFVVDQVNCVSFSCGMGGVQSDANFKYIPDSPNQFWRIFIVVFGHKGIIQFAIVLFFQIFIGKPLSLVHAFSKLQRIA